VGYIFVANSIGQFECLGYNSVNVQFCKFEQAKAIATVNSKKLTHFMLPKTFETPYQWNCVRLSETSYLQKPQFMGYISLSCCIGLALLVSKWLASKSSHIMIKRRKMAVQDHSKSSKVIECGTMNGKATCALVLVINSSHGCILHRLW